MKPDRMAAFEAPRQVLASRPMMTIKLKYKGWNKRGLVQTIDIPKMPEPDLITYRGHTFMWRSVGHYSEATVWPIIDELDN